MTFESSKSSANARHTQSQSQSDWRVAQHNMAKCVVEVGQHFRLAFLFFPVFLSIDLSFKAAKNILISLSCNIFISQNWLSDPLPAIVDAPP